MPPLTASVSTAAPVSDADLIAQARRGNQAAFAKLVEVCKRQVFFMVNKILHNPADADEVVQETLLRVHEHLSSFKGDSSFCTWMHRIGRNLALDLVRKARRRPTEEELDEGELPVKEEGGPVMSLHHREVRTRLQAAIQQLTLPQRAVLLLADVDDLKYAEIAEMLNVPVGTVMSRLHTARQKMQQLLGCVGPDCDEPAPAVSPHSPGQEPGFRSPAQIQAQLDEMDPRHAHQLVDEAHLHLSHLLGKVEAYPDQARALQPERERLAAIVQWGELHPPKRYANR